MVIQAACELTGQLFAHLERGPPPTWDPQSHHAPASPDGAKRRRAAAEPVYDCSARRAAAQLLAQEHLQQLRRQRVEPPPAPLPAAPAPPRSEPPERPGRRAPQRGANEEEQMLLGLRTLLAGQPEEGRLLDRLLPVVQRVWEVVVEAFPRVTTTKLANVRPERLAWVVVYLAETGFRWETPEGAVELVPHLPQLRLPPVRRNPHFAVGHYTQTQKSFLACMARASATLLQRLCPRANPP